jgi:hypothetical protein
VCGSPDTRALGTSGGVAAACYHSAFAAGDVPCRKP